MTTPNAGRVEVEVVADAGGFDRDLKRKVDRSLDSAEGSARRGGSRIGRALSGSFGKAARSLTTLPGAIAAGLAGGAVVGGIRSVVAAASDLGEQQSKVATVFGDSAGVVTRFADTAADALGISRVQALEAAGTYGNLFTAIGLTADKSAEMSTRLVGLAADLASFNNASPEETLLALQSGLNGEAEPLRRFGVLLDDATIKQKAFALGLSKSAKADITPAVKAQAAYAVILEQTKVAQDDVARTSTGLANTQRRLAAKTDNLKARLGAGLLPIVLKAATGVEKLLDGNSRLSPTLKRVGDAARGFADGFKKGEGGLSSAASTTERLGALLKDRVIPAVRDFAKAAGPLIVSAIGAAVPVVEALVTAGGALLGFLADNQTAVVALAGGVVAGVAAYRAFLIVTRAALAIKKLAGVLRAVAAGQVALNVAMAANPVGLVIAAVVGLGAALVIAYKKSETFREIVNGAFRAIGKAGLKVVDTILLGFEKLAGAAGKLPGPLGAPFRTAEEKIKQARGELDTLGNRLDEFGRKKASPTLVLAGVGKFEEDLQQAEKRFARSFRGLPGSVPLPKPTKPRRQVVAAEGGIVRRPTFLLAGEAGPEAIVPLHESGGGNGPLPGRGTTVVQHFHTQERQDPDALQRQAAFRFRAAAGV